MFDDNNIDSIASKAADKLISRANAGEVDNCTCPDKSCEEIASCVVDKLLSQDDEKKD